MPETLTARELIAALQFVDPDAPVVIDLKQYNKVYGVVQLGIYKDAVPATPLGRNTWVNRNYSGACITVHLPGEAYISKLPKEN